MTATMTMPATATKTIRTMLQAFGCYRNIQDPHGILDCPVTEAWFCFDERGRPFVSCGGTALIGFKPAGYCLFEYYLVLDDDDARRWDSANARNDHNGTTTALERGPRPAEVVKLVISA